MADSYPVLGQSAPTAASLTTLYTVPASTSAIASTLAICNRSDVATTIRVAIRPAGAAISNEHYIIYDALIKPNEFIRDTIGLGLETTDVVSVYNTLATVSFTLAGMEITP